MTITLIFYLVYYGLVGTCDTFLFCIDDALVRLYLCDYGKPLLGLCILCLGLATLIDLVASSFSF